ncbi:hypothetical protein GCM10027036_40600 [Flavihumibacter cheonanensis]
MIEYLPERKLKFLKIPILGLENVHPPSVVAPGRSKEVKATSANEAPDTSATTSVFVESYKYDTG